MSLRALQRSWDRLGATDPFWAILTDPDKKNNRWDQGEFFASGEGHIAYILNRVREVHPALLTRRALDFGCGVGRLTQPLAERFDEVCGVDISPSMIELARKFNRYGNRCRYVLNSTPDLRVFPDAHFDFINSFITLQHIQPRFSRRYLQEFMRILAPGGVAAFQLTSRLTPGNETKTPSTLRHFWQGLLTVLQRATGRPTIEMHGIEKDEVLALLAAKGGRAITVVSSPNAGPAWESYLYLVTRGGTPPQK